MNGKQVLGRQTKWGLVEVENKKHCDFSYLRDMLIRYGGEGCRCVCGGVEGYRCVGEGGMQVSVWGVEGCGCAWGWKGTGVCEGVEGAGVWGVEGAGVWRDRSFLYGDICGMCLNILINPWIITANPCILL